MKLADKIRKIRMEHGLTQAKLAQMMGTAPQCVCRWEKGVNVPDLKSLLKMADVLAIDERDLIDGDIPRQHTKEELLLMAEIDGLSADAQLQLILQIRKLKADGELK